MPVAIAGSQQVQGRKQGQPGWTWLMLAGDVPVPSGHQGCAKPDQASRRTGTIPVMGRHWGLSREVKGVTFGGIWQLELPEQSCPSCVWHSLCIQHRMWSALK